MYDTSIIQHVIPMIPKVKPIQQKLRKIHPNLESQIKNEFNKLLKAKIIFGIRHSRLVSNLVPVRKKNGDICICIDLRKLNKTCQKYYFPLPPVEQVLQSVVFFRTNVFSRWILRLQSNTFSSRGQIKYYVHNKMGNICISESSFQIDECRSYIPESNGHHFQRFN